jgi:hypothetical protein
MGADGLERGLQNTIKMEGQLHECIAILRALSLISRKLDKPGIGIHRLVQAVVKYDIDFCVWLSHMASFAVYY